MTILLETEFLKEKLHVYLLWNLHIPDQTKLLESFSKKKRKMLYILTMIYKLKLLVLTEKCLRWSADEITDRLVLFSCIFLPSSPVVLLGTGGNCATSPHRMMVAPPKKESGERTDLHWKSSWNQYIVGKLLYITYWFENDYYLNMYSKVSNDATLNIETSSITITSVSSTTSLRFK